MPNNSLRNNQDDGLLGRVAAVHGVVMDIDFPLGQLPGIGHALVVSRDNLPPVIVEVQAQLSSLTVRCISLALPTAVRRGLKVADTGQPVMVPVGDATLGRVFNVLGEPVDGGPPLTAVERRPIYGTPPQLTEQRAVATPYLTGIKALDLLAPLPQGGKVGLFGGPAWEKPSSFSSGCNGP
jgi:F-type H+/Na+-transporting ATPase subunit beta